MGDDDHVFFCDRVVLLCGVMVVVSNNSCIICVMKEVDKTQRKGLIKSLSHHKIMQTPSFHTINGPLSGAATQFNSICLVCEFCVC